METNWACRIERGENGFIVSHIEMLNDGAFRNEKHVFEDGGGSNVISFCNTVCWLMDLFAVYECSVKFFDKDEKEIEVD